MGIKAIKSRSNIFSISNPGSAEDIGWIDADAEPGSRLKRLFQTSLSPAVFSTPPESSQKVQSQAPLSWICPEDLQVLSWHRCPSSFLTCLTLSSHLLHLQELKMSEIWQKPTLTHTLIHIPGHPRDFNIYTRNPTVAPGVVHCCNRQ